MAEKEDHLEIPARDYSGWRNFPEGLRVFVFDEDLEYLRLMENFLQEFQYEVTTCNEEERAMYLLRNHINRFDIAIMDVHNSDGDRFRLISEIGSEMDLPIILISKDDSVESVTNWMSTSACDYLIKPIRPEDLRLIFKHVVKKLPGKRSVVTGEAEEKSAGEKSSSVGCSTKRNPNKRKRSICLDAEVNEEDRDDHDRACASSSKKRRVVWDNELHKKFLDAVEYLGLENAVPKKILEIMNVEGISRENVASHLQKFRLNQKKQNDQKREESNHYLITPQGRRIYVGEDASNFNRGINVQFPTHHIDNIPQPSYVQQQYTTTPNNLTTQRISPCEHHYDGGSIRNLMMTSTHQHHHQTSDFTGGTTEESLGYNSFNEDEPMVANLFFTPNFEEVPFQESFIATMEVPNDYHSSTIYERRDVHEVSPSPMLHFSSVSTSYTHSSFLDQRESGGCNNNSGYSVDNNELT